MLFNLGGLNQTTARQRSIQYNKSKYAFLVNTYMYLQKGINLDRNLTAIIGSYMFPNIYSIVFYDYLPIYYLAGEIYR